MAWDMGIGSCCSFSIHPETLKKQPRLTPDRPNSLSLFYIVYSFSICNEQRPDRSNTNSWFCSNDNNPPNYISFSIVILDIPCDLCRRNFMRNRHFRICPTAESSTLLQKTSRKSPQQANLISIILMQIMSVNRIAGNVEVTTEIHHVDCCFSLVMSPISTSKSRRTTPIRLLCRRLSIW